VILENAAEGEIILFKASRKMRLEKIIDEINERCFN
jgi:UDP-N-acetylmuramyl pentapeptide synthase